MKIVYSQLKQLIPGLKPAKQVADQLTLIGHFNDSFNHQLNEQIIGLEIRQNRADCLSYFGIAHDLAPLYGSVKLPSVKLPKIKTKQTLPIKVTTPENVDRIQALRISGLKNKPSSAIPQIQKLLKLHDINPINALVDLTNYIMLLYGIPCHAFDTKKSGQQLIWETNHKYKTFTTLDGRVLKLTPDILMVNSPQQALSLSFLGGRSCAIDQSTSETIIEMAVYNPTRVRQDSKSLKTITEASIRLEKFLDPHLIPQALNHLAYLIIKHCGGQITSQTFEYYPHPQQPQPINFDPQKPAAYAGVPISTNFSQSTLKKLNFTINKNEVTPATWRQDIELEEDLIEEVIRFYGYNKIPTNQPIYSQKLPDITPPILYIIDSIKNILVNLGYDEIRSWPLVNPKQLSDLQTAVFTQNNINSLYPALRQSITSSLIAQNDQYHRLKVPNRQFFEIGKIFCLDNGNYIEKHSLAFHHPQAETLQKHLDYLLSQLRLSANELIDLPLIHNNYAELILEELPQIVDVDYIKSQNLFAPKKSSKYTAIELNRQIVTLDANITLKTKQDPQKLLQKYSQKLQKHLWQIQITDIYQDPKTKFYRYTFSVAYFNLSSAKAKSLHLKTFDLT